MNFQVKLLTVHFTLLTITHFNFVEIFGEIKPYCTSLFYILFYGHWSKMHVFIDIYRNFKIKKKIEKKKKADGV